MNKIQSTAPFKKVEQVQFGVLSPDEIRAMSVVELKTADTLKDGVPVDGGLSDLRLGTTSFEWKCKTCKGTNNECPGHFGHLELAMRMFAPQYLKVILKVLRCVCCQCSKLLIDASDPRFKLSQLIENAHERLDSVYSISMGIKVCETSDDSSMRSGNDFSNNKADGEDEDEDYKKKKKKNKMHGGCGRTQPKYSMSGFEITAEFDPSEGIDSSKKFTAEDVYKILVDIPDAHCIAMGLNPKYARPEWMILTCIPIPPPPVRPAIVMDASSKRGEDDLTYKLADIIRSNDQLRNCIEKSAPAHLQKEYVDLLQYHLATFVNNEMPGIAQSTQRGGRPLKTISQRLKGKEGRVRGNLMGKRVDFSARSVISPDPNLALDELGVPRKIAMNLTIPERVTHFNYQKMQTLLENGPDEYPGDRKSVV